MRVKVRLLPVRKGVKNLTLDDGAKAQDAVKALGLHLDAWIPVRDDSPIPLDEPLHDGDDIKLIAVVSGG